MARTITSSPTASPHTLAIFIVVSSGTCPCAKSSPPSLPPLLDRGTSQLRTRLGILCHQQRPSVSRAELAIFQELEDVVGGHISYSDRFRLTGQM
jgi:hypothetical protein